MMTREEFISILTAYAGDDYKDGQSSLVESIVDDAIEEVRNARFPFGYSDEKEKVSQEKDVLKRYPGSIRRICEYHYDKIGKEGVTTFYEAGQTTSWEKGGTPPSFFHGIIPLARII